MPLSVTAHVRRRQTNRSTFLQSLGLLLCLILTQSIFAGARLFSTSVLPRRLLDRNAKQSSLAADPVVSTTAPVADIKRTRFCIEAWGEDVNSPFRIRTDTLAYDLSKDVNVTDIRLTDGAVVVRKAVDDADAVATYHALKRNPNYFAENEVDQILDASRPEAEYFFWGGQLSGGILTSEARLGLEASQGENFVGREKGYGTFKANDVCAGRDAFVAVRKGQIFCWGNKVTCTGWNDYAKVPVQSNLKALKVHCSTNARTFLVVINQKDEKLGGNLAIFGDPVSSSAFPIDADEELKNAVKAVDETGITLFRTNGKAHAMLLQGGRVLTWGEPTVGGKPTADVDLSFVRDLWVNTVGFAAITTTQRVVTWGDFKQALVPKRIIYGGDGEEKVVKVVPAPHGTCFAAVTATGNVATWGKTIETCAEQGGSGSEKHISYDSVKASLAEGVTRVVVNNGAFAAVKGDGSVITWGLKSDGADKRSSFEGWKPEDIKWAVPDTLVATDHAFGLSRTDSMILAWGDENFGGRLGRHGMVGFREFKANEESMAIIDANGDILSWGPKMFNIFQQKEATPGYDLTAAAKTMVVSPNGIVAILGTDCLYEPWEEWGTCSEECGGGMRKRSRKIGRWAVNGSCDYATDEQEKCNLQECEVEKKNYALTDLSTGAIVGLAIGGGVLFALVGFCVYNCRRRRTDAYM